MTGKKYSDQNRQIRAICGIRVPYDLMNTTSEKIKKVSKNPEFRKDYPCMST
jgi:hypothetical protein